MLLTSGLPYVSPISLVLQGLLLLPWHVHSSSKPAPCLPDRGRDRLSGRRGGGLGISLPPRTGGLQNWLAYRWLHNLLPARRRVASGGVGRLITRAINMELPPQPRLTSLPPSSDSHHICNRWSHCWLRPLLRPRRGECGEEREGHS